MKEENLLKAIIEKESWEEMIYYVVGQEKLNPWDIDIEKLVAGFLRFLKKVQELDFRIPAKIVFVASLLLRMKVEELFYKPKEIEPTPAETLLEFGIKPEELEVVYPIRKVQKRQITLEELIQAVKKAIEIKEKRERRKFFERDIIRREINVRIEEADIEQKINQFLEKLTAIEKERKIKEVPFSSIVGKWERDSIVDNFIPMLHLEMKNQIRSRQSRHFDEIFVKKLE